MRLIKCHVENFGKLANFDFDFADGLNTINQANGWGKSTFATFIKAMFYGLPSTTKKKLAENERKKYAPWQGGNYGGNLVFALGDKQYKIERFFGKNGAEDTFNLIDMANGKKSRDFGENIGTEIFDLDEAAFERSVYIPQKILDSNINESIAQKLTNLIQGTNADFNFETTYERLKKRRALLFNHNKTGEVQNLAAKIEEVTAQMRDLENSGRSVEIIQQQINDKDVTIATLVQQQNQIKQQIKTYGALQDQRAHQAMLEKMNHQMVATQNVLQAKQAVLKLQSLTVNEQSAVANDYTVQRYQTLTNYFGNKVPTAETAQAVYQDVLRVQTLQAQSANVAVAQNPAHKRQVPWLRWALLALAALCVVGGVVALGTQSLLAVVLFIVGGGALLAAGYLSLVNLINVKTSTPLKAVALQPQTNQAEIKQLQQGIGAFLGQYENAEMDPLTAVNRVLANLREYANLQTQIAAEIQTLQTRLMAEQQEIAQFKIDKHFDTATVGGDVEIDALQQRERDFQSQIDAERDARAQLVARVNKIQDDLAGLADLENEKAHLQNKLATLEQELSAVKNAMTFLEVANENMTTQFLAPMKNGLTKYLTLLTGRQFDNLNLDTDFNVAFEEHGQLRAVDYYSQGYQDLLALCMRFALIDQLFTKEKPFIILDDPLVNLDDAKIDKAKEFFQKLAPHYQIIYFACHSARC